MTGCDRSEGESPVVNVELTPEIEALVLSKVGTGSYHSASEVVGVALQLLEERDALLASRKGELKKKIAEGMESRSGGEGVDGEAVFDRLEAELDAAELSRGG